MGGEQACARECFCPPKQNVPVELVTGVCEPPGVGTGDRT